MHDFVFTGTAQVEIQGPRVLEFVALQDKQVEFKVIGLTNPTIKLLDSRPAVRRKMKEILKTEKVEELAEYFNRPARITILPPESGQQVVLLQKTRAKKPHHMLWVAIGVGDDIPFYDFKVFDMQEMTESSYALFSLYKRYSVALKSPNSSTLTSSPVSETACALAFA